MSNLLMELFGPSLRDYAATSPLAPLPEAGLGPMTNASAYGRQNAFMSAPHADRPQDAMSPVAHTLADLNPLLAAYMAGQAGGQAGMEAYSGRYSDAAGNALLAAFMLPGLRPRPSGVMDDVAAKERELNSLLDHPRDARDVSVPYSPKADPVPWSPHPFVEEVASTAPYTAPVAFAGASAMHGGDDADIAGSAAFGMAAGLGARYGVNALKRNMPPSNAADLAAANASRRDSLDAAIAHQKRVNAELLDEYRAGLSDNGLPALTYQPGNVVGLKPQTTKSAFPKHRSLKGYVDPASDPATPIEKPNRAAQQRYEDQERMRAEREPKLLAETARLREQSRAMDVERFARSFDNPDDFAKNIRLFRDATGMSTDEIVDAMRSRGMRIDHLSRHTLQKRDGTGRFQKLDPEAQEYLNSIRRRDRE